MRLIRFIILFFSLMFATTGRCEQYELLNVRLANGIEQSYSIKENIRIISAADSITVKSEHLEVKYARNSVVRYFFTSDADISSDIVSPTVGGASKIKVVRDERKLIIYGLPDDSYLRIFATNGTEIQTRVIYGKDSATVDFTSQPQGVYILHFGGSEIIPAMKFYVGQ